MKIPSNEKIVVTYVYEGVDSYVVTHNALKGKYTLYKIISGDYQKIKISESPLEFDAIVKKDRSK